MNNFNTFLDENMIQFIIDNDLSSLELSMNDSSMNDSSSPNIYSRTINRSIDEYDEECDEECDEEYDEYMNGHLQNMVQRYILSNTLLENQDQPNILNASLYETNPYKQIISNEGKKLLNNVIYDVSMCSNHICPISREDFKIGDEITVLPCNHGFIKEGIEKWLNNECPECPICRYKFDSIEVKKDDDQPDETTSINTSRNMLFNSLNTLGNIIHPFGRNQIFNTIPHSYIGNMYSNNEDIELNEAILNSLTDASSNTLQEEEEEE